MRALTQGPAVPTSYRYAPPALLAMLVQSIVRGSDRAVVDRVSVGSVSVDKVPVATEREDAGGDRRGLWSCWRDGVSYSGQAAALRAASCLDRLDLSNRFRHPCHSSKLYAVSIDKVLAAVPSLYDHTIALCTLSLTIFDNVHIMKEQYGLGDPFVAPTEANSEYA
jgi:hypothetical protein